MIKRKTWWLVCLLALALSMTACGDEQGTVGDNDEELPTNQDFIAPLEDLSTLTEGAPDNESLPGVAKSDEIFAAQFDLVDTQSPVSNQASRGICSVFSTVGLMEHLYIKEGIYEEPDFSEQYLQWSVKEEVGSFPNSSGSNANYNLQAVSDFGIVAEEHWEYEGSPWGASDDERCAEDDPPVLCFTNGSPPQEALDAPKYQLPRGRWISTRTRDIKAHMFHNEKAVVVGGAFYYQSWNHGASSLPTNQDYYREGYVLYPNETDREVSEESPVGHSILLVGWDDNLEVERLDGDGEVMLDDDGEPMTEKGFFIFKNSWGTGGFGVNNDYGDGYGYISYDYVEEFKSGRIAGTPGPEHIPSDAGVPECETNGECAIDELCEQNQCVPDDSFECFDGSDCDGGESCVDNQCVESTCDEQNPDCSDPLCIDAPACEGTQEEFAYTGDIQDIPDYDPDDGPGELITEIDVDGSGLIQELSVEVFIEHTWNGDLQIELIHPSGDTVEIREADGTSGDDVIEVFDVTAFDGMESEGTWQLRVTDNAEYDVGELVGWYLQIVR